MGGGIRHDWNVFFEVKGTGATRCRTVQEDRDEMKEGKVEAGKVKSSKGPTISETQGG